MQAPGRVRLFLPEMTKMRAVQVSAVGDISALKLVELKVPKVEPKQLLIRNEFCGVNFIDTYHRSGLYFMELPFIPGRYLVLIREASGIVEMVGDEVVGFQKGDRVAYLSSSTYSEYSVTDTSKFLMNIRVCG